MVIAVSSELDLAPAHDQADEAFRQDAARAWDEYQRTGLHLTLAEADVWLARLEAGEDVEPPACHV